MSKDQTKPKYNRRLREVRKEKGYSLEQVVVGIGYYPTYASNLSKFERGEYPNLPYELAEKLADFYGVPVSYLLGYEVEVPERLKEIGVEWLVFAEKMQKENITAEQVEKYVTAIKKLKESGIVE